MLLVRSIRLTVVVACMLAVFGGAASAPGASSVTPRIINGSTADTSTYAARWHFFAQLEYDDFGDWVGSCGGSLIAPDVVLTAAHCVEFDPDPQWHRVRIGSRVVGSGTIYAVADVEVHPAYDDDSLHTDVALLTLDRVVDAGDGAPIALAGALESAAWGAGGGVAEGTDAVGPWIGGTGMTESGDYATSFRNVRVPIASDAACAGSTPGYQSTFDPLVMLCAGEVDSDADPATPTTGQDACQGDSGGPMTVGLGDGSAGSWRLTGVVSSGIGCGDHHYGIFTRVAQDPVCSWIAANAGVAPLGGCLAAPAPATPPANDAFASAATVTAPSSIAGTTVGATTEPSEPSILGRPRTKSVWYRWTAPGTGIATFDTCSTGGGLDTVLAAFVGEPLVGGAVAITAADDGCSLASRASRISFRATVGQSYSVVIARATSGAGAPFVLTTAFVEDAPPVPIQPPRGVAVARQALGFTTISWMAPDTGPPPASYRIRRTDSTGRVEAVAAAGTAHDVPVQPGRPYTISVSSIDAAGAESSPSAPVTFTSQRDTRAPSRPGTSFVSRATRTQLTIRWLPASDAYGTVARYRIARKVGRRFVEIGTVGAARRSFTVSRLRPGRTYTLRIRAVDAAGNVGVGRFVVGRTRR